MNKSKIKYWSIILCCLMIFNFTALAQNTGDISGKVNDNEGFPMPGINIINKTSKNGTVTDNNGVFNIKANQGDELQLTFLGYKVFIYTVSQQTSGIIIEMEEDTQALDEVVVTALGIKRERKALGYSVGEVKGDELEKAKETNVINSLAGKIPGLIISQTAGGPSGSTRVLIRGNTELTGNNQPLYVIDGVPLDNTNFGSAGEWGGFDMGDGISSINPDDIDNISVLKGPAASALYGSRASHGVILITTKKADGKKRIGIEFNSTTTFEQQLTKYHDIQSIYGQGNGGRITGTDSDKTNSSSSWGPKIDPGLYI